MKQETTLNYQVSAPVNGIIRYQDLTLPLSPYQHKLYKKALYGIEEYTKEEKRSLSQIQKEMILVNQRQLWKQLNIWKNEIINAPVKDWLKNLFWHSPLMKSFMEYPESDRAVKKTFTQMGISDRAIATKAVEWGFLPINFFEINSHAR